MSASGTWSPSCSWFDLHHAHILPDIFPGFYRLWNDPIWGESIRTVLYWYLTANHRKTGIGIDTGIILSQVALEKLAWTHCVLDRKIAKKKDFKPGGKNAAQKLTLMLADLGIPTHTPIAMRALRKRSSDGPTAVTQIRNSLVHPKRTNRLTTNELFQAWKLTMWYLDVILLKCCSHSGGYADRRLSRWVGEIQSTP